MSGSVYSLGDDMTTQFKDRLLDNLAQNLEMWAQLQCWYDYTDTSPSDLRIPFANHVYVYHRTLYWEAEHSLESQTSEQIETNHQSRGLELVCTASQFQRHIIARLLWYSNQNDQNENDSFTWVMLSFYHCINIDISKMFNSPTWLSLHCGLPVMPHPLSHDQATRALLHAENALSHLHLEAILYGPTLYVLGMEMARNQSDRRRVLGLIERLRSKGFLVVDRFLGVIEDGWASGCY